MKFFLAGGAGAVGTRLVPLLVAGGHHVIATTRTPDKLKRLRAQGAEPIGLDSLRMVAINATSAKRPARSGLPPKPAPAAAAARLGGMRSSGIAV